jgi:hypothetical protein
MRIAIQRNGATICTVRPQSGRLQQQLLGVNIITFNLTIVEPFEFSIGDYLTFEGEKFTMNILPTVKKYSRYRYEYALTFEAPQYQLRNAQYLFWGEDDDLARNGSAEFSLVATPREFAQLALTNANRIGGAWTLGSCIDAEAREVSFNGDNCLSTLQRLAREFDTEFYFEGNTLHFARKNATLPYTFRYGKGNTLYDIERTVEDVGVCTRLYAFGSDRNLPYGYRGGAQRLRAASGYFDQNTEKFGVIEATQTFDDVYPHREGVISAVDPANPLVFVDGDMPFDLAEKSTDGSASVYKYLLPGAKAKVKFNTGNLAGYEFELAAYLHANRKFTLTPINEKFGNPDAALPGSFALPNAALKPAVGDRYVLLDIALPQAYIEAAEAQLIHKAQEYLSENSSPKTAYRVTPNEIEFTRNQLKLILGATVHLIDEPLGIDRHIRITGFERSLDNIYKYTNVALAAEPRNLLVERKFAAYRQQVQIDGSQILAAIANRRSSIIEDVTANYTTDIDGGLILTTLIQMRGLEADGSLKTNAGVSGLTNEVNPVRFWAGSDFSNRNTAPFRVRHDGSVALTKASLATSGSGKRIEISSADGTLELYDSNNVKRVEINDGEGTTDGGQKVNSGVIKINRGAGKFELSARGVDIDGVDGRRVILDGGVLDISGARQEGETYDKAKARIVCGNATTDITLRGRERVMITCPGLPQSAFGLTSGQFFVVDKGDGTGTLCVKM